MGEVRTERGWAVAGDFGLYMGWHISRTAAIRDHVVEKFGIGERTGRLTAAQKRAWARCRKDGGRAVKVELTYK